MYITDMVWVPTDVTCTCNVHVEERMGYRKMDSLRTNGFSIIMIYFLHLPLFSWYSTAAYHIPPVIVRRMPTALAGVIVSLNRMTAQNTESTCLTLAVCSSANVLLYNNSHSPATVILRGPAALFAVKLTILSPNAITPLTPRSVALTGVISCTLHVCTRDNSPVRYARKTHWMNASGAMRVNRSSGCNLSRGGTTKLTRGCGEVGDGVDCRIEV